jgi:hypothetical protein
MKLAHIIITGFLGVNVIAIACAPLPIGRPSAAIAPSSKAELKIVNQEMSHDAIGSVILGRVRNDGKAARFVQINCDFETMGQLNDTGFTYANPIDLAPGETASFEVRSLKKGSSTYTCIATGNI